VTVPSLDQLTAQAPLRGQRVFVRADLNVPTKDGVVGDDTRIRATLPTLRRLLEAGARVIVASHLGRPKGKADPKYSLAPVAQRLGELLGSPIVFVPDCVGVVAEAPVAQLPAGRAALADVYVNDAFGTAHRAHASTVGMVAWVPRVAAGDLLRAELEHLQVVLHPKRPLVCLLGGAKVSDKIAVLEALSERADVLAIGGAMAYTFLRAQGEPTGNSRVEEDRIGDAGRVLQASAKAGRRILLPVDHVVAENLAPEAVGRVVKQIPEGWLGVDIGPETAGIYAAELRKASTIFWNGPMGVFEIERFAQGTETLARAIADSKAVSVVGGGDSLAAVNKLGLASQISHLSTGGGASLEFVQGLTLPGVAALER